MGGGGYKTARRRPGGALRAQRDGSLRSTTVLGRFPTPVHEPSLTWRDRNAVLRERNLNVVKWRLPNHQELLGGAADTIQLLEGERMGVLGVGLVLLLPYQPPLVAVPLGKSDVALHVGVDPGQVHALGPG